jgi:sister chromatid cohesion protein DCC1
VRWRPDDIAPFLDDICLDAHERERLLLKYARAVSGPDGVWLTGRTL